MLDEYNTDAIQANQYGDTQRQVPKTLTIALVIENDKTLHPLITEQLKTTDGEPLRSLLGK